jgi:hypothetical protein
LISTPTAFGQSIAERPAFKVATVKRDPHSGPVDFRVTPGGWLTVTNLTLTILIREAYR